MNDRSSIDSTRESVLSRRGCPEQFNRSRGRLRSKLVRDLRQGKRWSADRCNLQGWPVSHPGTSAANSSLSAPPVCLVPRGVSMGRWGDRARGRKRVGIKVKFKGVRQLTGLTGFRFSGSQPAQSKGLTINPKLSAGSACQKDVYFELNPNFICEICGSKVRCNA